jgi:hypothetical protein
MAIILGNSKTRRDSSDCFFKKYWEFYLLTQPPNSYLNFNGVQNFWDSFTRARDDKKININSRQENNNNNNTKKTLEDFHNCCIMSRQEPAYFSNEVQSPG